MFTALAFHMWPVLALQFYYILNIVWPVLQDSLFVISLCITTEE